ncbi:hypothetical protein BDQ17DRAFT_1334099 [Cyathus striatus]|nr:hypothetical protein BDQ17DRAFT_1334099 [Cyathus striatus]
MFRFPGNTVMLIHHLKNHLMIFTVLLAHNFRLQSIFHLLYVLAPETSRILRIPMKILYYKDYQKVRDLFMYSAGIGPTRLCYLSPVYSRPRARRSLFPSTPDLIYTKKTVVLPPQVIPNTGVGISYTARPGLHPSVAAFFSLLKHRKWSLILSALSAGSLLAHMEIINHLYIMQYCKDIILSDDLKDIAGRYQSREALKKGSQFWVVEDDMNNIVACAGLDTTSSTPEVRRMCVHPSHSSLWIRRLILNNLFNHMHKHNMDCGPDSEFRATDMVLSTLMLQPGAISVYQEHGWTVEKMSECHI